MLVWSVKNYGKQQTPAGTICHLMSCSQQCGPLTRSSSKDRKDVEGAAHIRRWWGPVEKRKCCPRLAAPWSATHMSSEILPCLFCDDANASLNTPSSKWSVQEIGYQHQGHMFTAALKCDEVVTRYPDTLSQQKTYKRSRQHLHRQEHNTPQQADP